MNSDEADFFLSVFQLHHSLTRQKNHCTMSETLFRKVAFFMLTYIKLKQPYEKEGIKVMDIRRRIK